MTQKEQLIGAWTRNLEDNAEHQLHAIGLLTEEIDDNAASLPEVAAMMQKVTPQSRNRRRRVMWSLAILAVLVCIPQLLLPIQLRKAIKQRSFWNGQASNLAQKIRTHSPEELLLLYGNPDRFGKAEQMRALWESDPKNPAYFADYSLRYMQENRNLPPDFLKIAAQIDPDNAWFTCIAAAIKAVGTSTNKRKNVHPRSPVSANMLSKASDSESRLLRKKIIYEYEIVDPTRAQEALDLWRLSLKQSKYDSYEIALYQQRYPLLRPRHSYVDQFPPLIYLLEHPSQLQTRELAKLLAASLQQADMQSDEGKQLISDIDVYMERLIGNEPATFTDLMIVRSIIQGTYQQIEVIDTAGVEPKLVEKWIKHKAAFDEYERILIENRVHNTDGELMRRHGSMLASMVLPVIHSMKPVAINKEDLAPLRYADHALFLRVIASSVCALLIFMIPFHLLGRRNKLIHKVSEEAWKAVSWSSLFALVLLAVVVPLLYYLLINGFTPLSGKEFGSGFAPVVPFYPAISVALLLLLVPRLLVHRLIAPWERLVNFRSRWHLRLGWLACLLLLVPLHTTSLLLESSITQSLFLGLYLACWVPAWLWLFWNGARGLFSRNFYSSAMHGLCRRVVGLCTVCTILILSLTGFGLKACESYWIQKDKLLELSPDHIALGNYEADVIKAIHQELLSIIEK